jgi:hypothetical protein
MDDHIAESLNIQETAALDFMVLTMRHPAFWIMPGLQLKHLKHPRKKP